jgi:aspartate/methionine/tyrosine aminotransferase
MLREAHVAATAGLDFDQEQGQGHLRLSYAGSTADMREASRRINSWLPKYLKTL